MTPRLLAILLLAPLLAGCLDDGYYDDLDDEGAGATGDGGGTGGNEVTPGTAPPAPENDQDLDGILDTTEAWLADGNCRIAGATCASLGVAVPSVGTRDLIVAQFGRSGEGRDWRLPDSVWATFHTDMASHGITAQVIDLGTRDDIDVEASWTDPANAGKFWMVWVTYLYPPDVPDSAGWNEWNWIEMQDQESAEQQTLTLMHEVYHALLGDLRGQHSTCPDAETGGAGHSDDSRSVLYVSTDCYSQEDPARTGLGAGEARELAEEPFENLRLMNEPGWADTWF